MEDTATLRLAAFVALFVVFATLEALSPRRARHSARWPRWGTNIAMTLLSALLLRGLALAIPLLAIGAAMDAQTQDWGLLNRLDWPAWVAVLLAVVAFDFFIWLQHLITHKVPVLWRLHRVHHADTECDVTTAIRFHPVEIALSMLLKIGLVYLIGPPVLAVVLFEILLNGTALFNHANLRMPQRLDAVIRWLLVTPDMHRVHHSVHRHEHDSNYGFALSLWDRAFGTYCPQPQDGHQAMQIGLQWRDRRPSRLRWSLTLPFTRK